MHKIIHLAPSILAADFARLGEQVQEAEANGAELIHIDVMDGQFVPNISMGKMVVEAVRRVTHLPLDVHLMIVQPAQHIEAFAHAGADRITVHYEADHHLHRTLMAIKALGCMAGVAINPHTSALTLEAILPFVDQVIVMTVNPGFGGQEFIPEMMSKVAEIHAMIGNLRRHIDLEVDGGINAQTAMSAAQAGANILVVGSAVFNPNFSVAEGMARLKKALTTTTP
ncbi:MAG: ribulose-phosphate 3-epimerase [Phototrophicales bacterium]|nr:ribulose-phosphate 3-epimerase [Phototrophicales bacterium]